MHFTMFQSLFDREKVEYAREWGDVVERAKNPRTFARKHDMPLLKLARFGDAVRSAEGFLRNAANMLAVSGGEGDHDAGTIAPIDAITVLGSVGVRSLVYASPSHTDTFPRWRVLFPFSCELLPPARARMVARINGLLSGSLAGESFTLAQAFFWGCVATAPYVAHATALDLPCIDERDDLAAYETYPAGHTVTPNGAVRSGTPDRELREAVLEGVPGEVYRALVKLSARLVGRGMPEDDALGVLHALLDSCSWQERDPATWRTRYGECAGLVVSAARRYADRRVPVVTVPEVRAVEGEVLPRAELVPTGVLIPRSVLISQEVTLNDLGDLGLTKSKLGVYHNNVGNAELIAQASLNGRLWLDSSTGNPMLGLKVLTDIDPIWRTGHVNRLPGGHAIAHPVMRAAMLGIAERNPIDPWQEWLAGLTWDGVERLDTMGADYFGITPGADGLESLMFRKLMVAVVARQFQPGAKFDAMVVLEGSQGTRKSTALRALFGNPYVASWENDFNTKDFRQQLQGNICIEVAELASFARSEMAAIKSILSETVDVYRPSYGRTVERRPRRCVLIGTSNEDSYLSDVENRRFWPFRCGMINVEGLHENREQLFAEAVVAYHGGGVDARWWELPGRIRDEQADRLVDDPWHALLRGYLAARNRVRIYELMHEPLQIPTERQHTGTSKRIAGILRTLGWRRQHDVYGNFWTP